MYDAVTRNTYAQLFKLAEENLPGHVRDALIKTASLDAPLSAALSTLLNTPQEAVK